MLDFMMEKGVKIVVVACGTISNLIDEIRNFYDLPIISIIEAACNSVAKGNPDQIGVFATDFTINAGVHRDLIRRQSPGTQVFGVPSHTLASLVDKGQSEVTIKAEVSSILNILLKAAPNVKDVILGCTHYPLIQDLFEQAASGINFINPASLQAEAVKALLEQQGLLYKSSCPGLEIFTSGEKQQYEATIKKLNIIRPYSITILN